MFSRHTEAADATKHEPPTTTPFLIRGEGEVYFHLSLLILYVQQYSMRAHPPEVIHDDPKEQPCSLQRDSPGSPLKTYHIQERRTPKSRMATIPAAPPGKPATIPSRTIPISYR